ncbi:MAG TPA: RIP metalloprotease RseP [Firmicutes bacterium]|nr:RIP metalloprotease RseP [Bacillota bacterium]
MLTFVSFVVVFGAIVFFHEFGHFLVAKLAGITVYEFALGFGPVLTSKKRRGTKYSLRAFPLGGFVKMAGMDEPQEGEEVESDDPGSFHNKSLAWRLGTISAGPLMNFVLAVLLFFAYFMFVEVPPRITLIEQGSVAEKAGFLPGDEFISFDGEKVSDTDEIIARIQAAPQRELAIVVKRERRNITILVVPEEREGRGILGIGIADTKPKYPFWLSLKGAFTQTGRVTAELVRGLGRIITGREKAELSGPIGIVQLVGQTAKQSLADLLLLAILLTINLGLLNLLPVPVLDGGWIVILVVEAIRGRPLAPKARGIAQFIGLALLVLLMIFATIKDISRLNLFS